eukprot:917715_1
MSEEEAYSQLSASDESVIISTLLICAVGTTLAFIILFSLCFRKNERDHPRAFTFAVLSVICSIFAYMTVLLWGNNLLIHWKFDGKHQTFVSLSDGFFMVFYTFSKITFWCSWTYHVLNMCDANHDSTTRKYLTAWMIIGCVRLSTGMIGFLVTWAVCSNIFNVRLCKIDDVRMNHSFDQLYREPMRLLTCLLFHCS